MPKYSPEEVDTKLHKISGIEQVQRGHDLRLDALEKTINGNHKQGLEEKVEYLMQVDRNREIKRKDQQAYWIALFIVIAGLVIKAFWDLIAR